MSNLFIIDRDRRNVLSSNLPVICLYGKMNVRNEDHHRHHFYYFNRPTRICWSILTERNWDLQILYLGNIVLMHFHSGLCCLILESSLTLEMLKVFWSTLITKGVISTPDIFAKIAWTECNFIVSPWNAFRGILEEYFGEIISILGLSSANL